jgi:hypothetical protein
MAEPVTGFDNKRLKLTTALSLSKAAGQKPW